ncbi:hypothetical protein KKF34_13250 [Myxococcota bacterium]|nr:hypothetical protein [Myxococcota bacterium]MBU1381934.1 hypothetical protein [Myxococcota bacterium]MBU1497835.1 hypothetical protein [Myxococcota bacterium]
MPHKKKIVIYSILTVFIISTAVLSGTVFWLAHKFKNVQHKSWKACRKLSMQHILFEKAREKARSENKKLVVIGNPTGGWVNRIVPIYGCGDICIDIAGCSPCPESTIIYKMDAIEALKKIPDNSAVVFESEVFEYVGDMQNAIHELDRITGKDHSRIFAVHTISISHWDYHIEGRKPTPPCKNTIRSRKEGRKKYAKTGEGMAKRIIYRFPPRDRYEWSDL